MVRNILFFDVPIYRLPEDKYYAEREKYIDKMMYGTDPEERRSKEEFYERNPDNKINFEDHLQKSFGGPWTFNEIIGYIRLYFLGTQIRGELWMVNKKRLVRTRKKLILWQSHNVSYEERIPFSATNEEVFEAILTYLDRAKKEVKGRVIDTAKLEALGKYVDWNGLRNSG